MLLLWVFLVVWLFEIAFLNGQIVYMACWGWFCFGRRFAEMGHASARLHFAVHCHSLPFKEVQLFAVHIWRLIVDLCTGPIEGVYALPHSWSLLETLCRTYRGVGRYWLKTSRLAC